jgi:hypothetical protein
MSNVNVELDDNGDVVRMTPPASVVENAGDTVTYLISARDGTDWHWLGYSETPQEGSSNMVTNVGPASGPNGEPGIQLTVGGGSTAPGAGQTTTVTLLYNLTISGATDMSNQPLGEITFTKSFDPMIIFR